MYLSLSLKNIRHNKTLYIVFGVLMVLLITASLVLLAENGKARDEIDDMLREYGGAYKIQDSRGFLPSRDEYERLLALDYVKDIEYIRYTHIIQENNLVLKVDGKSREQIGMLMLTGLPDFSEVPALSSGSYPERDDDCVLGSGYFEGCELGCTVTVADALTGTEQGFQVVGILDADAESALLGSDNYSGGLIVTTMDSAYAFYSPDLKNNVFIDGIVNGLDAKILLTDIDHGDELKEYVSMERDGSVRYTAAHYNPGFESASRSIRNMADTCLTFQRIVAALVFLAVFFFVLLKTNLKVYEICILRSMGLSHFKIVLLIIVEYGVFLLGVYLVGILLSMAAVSIFIDGMSMGGFMSLCKENVRLIYISFLIVLVAAPISAVVIDRRSLTKIIRSSENI